MGKVIKFGSLFTGIGGMDLGLERAGMTCAWQVEIDDYATRVLTKHWPDVPKLRDVRDCGRDNLQPVDLICGGFPCQDVSLAGKREGLQGKRTTLWSEFARIVGELRPRWVLAENVPGLLSSDNGMFFGRILSDLAAFGYDAEWDCIPAASFGAPHRRDRVFLVGYSECCGCTSESTQSNRAVLGKGTKASSSSDIQCHVPNSNRCEQGGRVFTQWVSDWGDAYAARNGSQGALANTTCIDEERPITGKDGCRKSKWAAGNGSDALSDATGAGLERQVAEGRNAGQSGLSAERDWWATEPNVGRVVNGVPARVDRLRCLGNAVVPQIIEWIGGRIMKYEETR